jgi:hypothetical protein
MVSPLVLREEQRRRPHSEWLRPLLWGRSVFHVPSSGIVAMGSGMRQETCFEARGYLLSCDVHKCLKRLSNANFRFRIDRSDQSTSDRSRARTREGISQYAEMPGDLCGAGASVPPGGVPRFPHAGPGFFVFGTSKPPGWCFGTPGAVPGTPSLVPGFPLFGASKPPIGASVPPGGSTAPTRLRIGQAVLHVLAWPE